MAATTNQNLDYAWIIRCSGSSPGHCGEFRSIDSIPNNSLVPIIEIIDDKIWDRYYSALSSKFSEVFVELPLYLNEIKNKWWNEGSSQCRNINNQSCLDFFTNNDHRLDVPIVSSDHNNRNVQLDYSAENALLSQVKANFSRVGLRIGIPTYDISSIQITRTSLINLLNQLNASDTLFIDIYNIGSLIQQRLSNLNFVINNTPQNITNIFVLNAFEPDHLGHNYGPYLARHFNVKGFGDFATEKRYPSKVKRGPGVRRFRRNIHYYNWNRFELYTFSEYESYRRTAGILRSSGIWRSNPNHRQNCPACWRVENGDYNNWTVYWKEFRIKHYINSIVNDTRALDNGTQPAEDLDPIGHDTLFNVGRSP